MENMDTYTEYLYSFANASLTLRVVEHLHNNYQSQLDSIAVINLIDRWLVQVNLQDFVDIELAKNLQAFLKEMGVSYQPSIIIAKALAGLKAGESPTKIMNRDRIVIVAHGKPEKKEIEIFREQVVARLGYCPRNMA